MSVCLADNAKIRGIKNTAHLRGFPAAPISRGGKRMTKLSKITKVNPREVWAHEAQDFTKWLAAEENISLLSDELQIQFENVRVESAAGRFFVDIVADAADNGGKVIIENQLGTSDHGHLGQCILYGSHRDAKTVVWICETFDDRYIKALQWLNDHFKDKVGFYGIEVKAYGKLGDIKIKLEKL